MRAPTGENEPEPKWLCISGGLQPQASDPELLIGLEDFEGLEVARRLERLVEHEIVLELQLQRFDTTTPEWKVFASALAEYGYSVFKGWFISGVVHGIAARHAGGRGVFGLRKIPEGLRLPADDAHALAADLVIRSIAAFRDKTLMSTNPGKRWRPDGGASIKTFFVGRCLMELPDLYHRWARQEGRFARQGTHYADLEQEDRSDAGTDTESSATAAALLEELRAMSDDTTMVMFELQVAGYTYEEIAEMLSSVGVLTTPAQVRTRMSRARASLRRHS